MERARNVTTPRTDKSNLAVQNLLGKIFEGQDLMKYRSGARLFSQGEHADAIYFMRAGSVQLTVESMQGKTAILATMGPGDFLGEECLVGDSRRTSTAVSRGPSTAFRIEKDAMVRAIHLQPEFSEEFVASLLARKVNMEEDLCDQLFNHSEQRLARILLKLARLVPHPNRKDVNMPGLTNQRLAGLLGTTRSEVMFFMNKFKNLGLIEYAVNGDVTIMSELLTDMVVQE